MTTTQLLHFLFQACVVVFGVACIIEVALLASALVRGVRAAKSIGGVFASCKTAISASPRLVAVRRIQFVTFISGIVSAVLLMLVLIFQMTTP
jgi:hypothetical protein